LLKIYKRSWKRREQRSLRSERMKKNSRAKTGLSLFRSQGYVYLWRASLTDSLKRISSVYRGLWSKPRRTTPTCKTCTTASVVSNHDTINADKQKRHSDCATFSRNETRRLTDLKMHPKYMRVKSQR